MPTLPSASFFGCNKLFIINSKRTPARLWGGAVLSIIWAVAAVLRVVAAVLWVVGAAVLWVVGATVLWVVGAAVL